MPRNAPTLNQRPATPRAVAQVEPQMLTVKAVVDQRTDSNGQTYDSPRVVYDINDMPIPHEDFVTTPLTASLVLAIKAGDLIENEATPGMESGMPSEFGGRPTEERQQQRQERQERSRQEQGSSRREQPRQEQSPPPRRPEPIAG